MIHSHTGTNTQTLRYSVQAHTHTHARTHTHTHAHTQSGLQQVRGDNSQTTKWNFPSAKYDHFITVIMRKNDKKQKISEQKISHTNHYTCTTKDIIGILVKHIFPFPSV